MSLTNWEMYRPFLWVKFPIPNPVGKVPNTPVSRNSTRGFPITRAKSCNLTCGCVPHSPELVQSASTPALTVPNPKMGTVPNPRYIHSANPGGYSPHPTNGFSPHTQVDEIQNPFWNNPQPTLARFSTSRWIDSPHPAGFSYSKVGKFPSSKMGPFPNNPVRKSQHVSCEQSNPIGDRVP
jgi:hypothetical protein